MNPCAQEIVQASKVMKRQKRILVVDDDLGVRKMLTRVVVDEGYSVQTTAGGDKALAIARRSVPDLVLLDVKLRRESGWEVFRRLVQLKPLLPGAFLSFCNWHALEFERDLDVVEDRIPGKQRVLLKHIGDLLRSGSAYRVPVDANLACGR